MVHGLLWRPGDRHLFAEGMHEHKPWLQGPTHPMNEYHGKWTPDLRYRYLTEDVPMGMCFNTGLREILEIPMLMTDRSSAGLTSISAWASSLKQDEWPPIF